MNTSRPVDGEWYPFDQFKIVLPGYGGRIEIVPYALLYPSLGTDMGNWVGVIVRVVSHEITAEFQFDASVNLFSKLYEDLQAFPTAKNSFDFPGDLFIGEGVWCKIEPKGIHGWQVHCKMIHGDVLSWLDRSYSSCEVHFRLNHSEMEAQQQTADFLRFVASLAKS